MVEMRTAVFRQIGTRSQTREGKNMTVAEFTKKAFGYLRWQAIRAGIFNHMDDERYLKMIFKSVMGKPLDLENPVTFNEKIQWLKLYDRKAVYTDMVDKYAVKKLISEKIGSEYVIELLGVWDNADEIDFDALPEQFVLKCTHDSGSVVVCRNKAELDIPAVRKMLNEKLRHNYYYSYREWPYKDVKPRIIAEKFMQDEKHKQLQVYKYFCFSGKPYIIQTITNDKLEDETIDYFDTDWNRLDMKQNFPNSTVLPTKPECLQEMNRIAQIAAEGMRFIRVDLYCINKKVYFSEYTFYTDAGMARFEPADWDQRLGEMIVL